MDDAHIIPQEHLMDVCKYRQKGCCRYIVFSQNINDFCCVKTTPDIKQNIDEIVHELKAQGDNCEGL
jgi:hypothetical protein